MPSSKTALSCLVLATLAFTNACATTPETAEAEQQAILPKPTPQEIASIAQAEPLARADFWNKYYNLHPTDLDISMAFIAALNEIGSHERAAEVATLTTVSFPDNSDVFLLAARTQRKAGQPLDAIRSYNRVSQLRPYDATPFAAMGGIFDQQGDHVTAQEAYRKALAIDPNRPATLSNYGLSLALTGDIEKAEETLRKAAELPTATAAIRQNLALILGLRGKFKEAREIAAIDAPDGVAERNTEFLRNMIGNNPALKQIAAVTETNAQPEVVRDVPIAAPVEEVVSAALDEEFGDGTSDTQPSDAETARRPLRLKSRSRGGL